MKKEEGKKKIFVALSGGVDSSVSAALLKEAGYEITGVFIKVWQPDFLSCTWQEDRLDAMRVCAKLNIPFLTFDFSKEYKEDVVDYMLREYRAGRTPNPDVMCNRSIKFGAFLRKAKELGADGIATGHYARIVPSSDQNYIRLFRGNDSEKDQTYFLWTLTQDDLTHTLFPIGNFEKSEVREKAKMFNLPTAAKKDSQGLCFIGKLDMRSFLKHYIDAKPGKVLDEAGNCIGEHEGAELYTLGQRHGFTVVTRNDITKPHYVIGKDIRRNTITVSSNILQNFSTSKVQITNVNWVAEKGKEGDTYLAQVRYRQKPFSCTISRVGKNTAHLVLDDETIIIPPGQSLVLYRDDECVGGGIIA